EGDTRNEDIHLADLEAEHALGRFHDVGLHGGGHVGELGFRVDGDEHLEMDCTLAFDVHSHAAMRGLAAHPVTAMPSRGLVHSFHTLDLAPVPPCAACGH